MTNDERQFLSWAALAIGVEYAIFIIGLFLAGVL